jgi:chromosome segregation ATPase
MNKIPEEIVLDWIKNKKRIQDKLNRINKRLRKLEKQKIHFEKRLRVIKQHELAKISDP